MYRLRYDEATGFIYVKKEEGTEVLMEERFSSNPAISPDGRRAAYITPLEWESESSLYVYNLETGAKREVDLDIDRAKEKVKGVEWLDDQRLVLIIGGIYGTVDAGGNIYQFDLEKESLVPVKKYQDGRTQAVKLHVLNEALLVDTMEDTDQSMSGFVRKQEELPLPNPSNTG